MRVVAVLVVATHRFPRSMTSDRASLKNIHGLQKHTNVILACCACGALGYWNTRN